MWRQNFRWKTLFWSSLVMIPSVRRGLFMNWVRGWAFHLLNKALEEEMWLWMHRLRKFRRVKNAELRFGLFLNNKFFTLFCVQLFGERSEKIHPPANDLSIFFLCFFIIKNFINVDQGMDFLKPRWQNYLFHFSVLNLQ